MARAAGRDPQIGRVASKYFALFDQFTQRLVLLDQMAISGLPVSEATARARQE
jgi:hypothetical protein